MAGDEFKCLEVGLSNSSLLPVKASCNFCFPLQRRVGDAQLCLYLGPLLLAVWLAPKETSPTSFHYRSHYSSSKSQLVYTEIINAPFFSLPLILIYLFCWHEVAVLTLCFIEGKLETLKCVCMMKVRGLTDVSLHTIQDRRRPYVKSLEPAVCAHVWICSVYGERTPSLLHLLMYVVRGIVCTVVFSHLCFLFNFVTDPNTLIAQIQHRNSGTCFSAYS